MTYLTHKQVETMLGIFMEKAGWERVKDKRYKFARLQPDRVFQKEGNKILVFEVKPENAKPDEVAKGIGQSARYLVYDNIKPYLVISTKHYYQFREVFTKLSWLGVIAYTREYMELEQRASDREERETPVDKDLLAVSMD